METAQDTNDVWDWSRGSRRAAHGGYAAVVAVGQFLQRRALRAPSSGLFLLCRCEGRGRSIGCPRAWRGSCLRRCGCGLDRARHRQARRVPPASSARCWCRCRPTVRPVSEFPPSRRRGKKPPDGARRALRCRNWRTATMSAYPRFAAPRAPLDIEEAPKSYERAQNSTVGQARPTLREK